MRLRRELDLKRERIARLTADAARLEDGEFINAALLNRSWSGLFALSRSPAARAVMRRPVDDELRVGFVNPRHPVKSIPKPSGNIVHALFAWARKNHVIPSSGTKAQEALFAVLDAIRADAIEEGHAALTKSEQIQARLDKLNRANWQSVNLITPEVI